MKRTRTVLELVYNERVAQEARYGHVNDKLLNGTGPLEQWLRPYTDDTADAIEFEFRKDYERFEERMGLPTWARLVREELAEALKESDPERLAEELVQVAALCVSWVERLRVTGCEECGADDGPHFLDGHRLCASCLEEKL